MPTLRERIYAALGFKVRRRDRLLKKIIEKAERSEIHKSSIGRPLEPIFPSPVSKKTHCLSGSTVADNYGIGTGHKS
jgi:hypothetical protein